ncbi:MAG: TetR/AcrR family transcriptional regulator [bacterium]|nr:TetR/AcrR family transcriptional regulator [bacterium]
MSLPTEPTSTPDRANHRQRQKEETRRIVRECAAELFEQKGFAKTTMRELATRAGVGLGTIFKHFPDKGSLLVACYREDIGEVTRRGLATLPEGDLQAQLLHLTTRLYAFYAQRPALSRVLARESTLMEGTGADEMRKLFADFLERVAELFAIAQERGELGANIDCQDATAAFWSFYYSGLIGGLMAPEFSVEAMVEFVRRLLEQHFQGIIASDRPSGTKSK